MTEEVVVIVGAGQSGLATAACLTALSVPCLILERDDCIGSLWRNRCYDRVTLHLAKQYSELPHAPHPPSAPTYLPKRDFIRYLDDYAARFRLRVSLRRNVESAEYDEAARRWRIAAKNAEDGAVEEYTAKYLVVASGENDEAAVPEIPGLEGFHGPVVHSSQYRSGSVYEGNAVLVVGCGNSGMEVALDLAEHGARTFIVVRICNAVRNTKLESQMNSGCLQNDDSLIGEDGMAKQMFPNHWKGKNRIYCAGLARRGIYGSGEDAQSIANDIASDYQSGK
ncbi:hypothetical protein BHM03_00062412 [Ensete ventricosum]|nr:hypothetical protein BHM03_00062412 [Ensete ventricosum]